MKRTALLLLPLALAGCGQIRSAVGMNRQSPDEFSVMTQQPLEIPADMASLPPPQPGVARPQDRTVQDQASAALSIGGTTTDYGPSDGESALLANAQTGAADPAIRQTVNAEAADDRKNGETIGSQILFWQKRPQPGTIVDPEAEKTRIQSTREAGKPVTDGDTPMIEPHVPGTLLQ